MMLKLVALFSLAAAAMAFAPAQQSRTVTSLNAEGFDLEMEGYLGAQPPLGVWDPLNLLALRKPNPRGPATQERFDRLRYVELKHGRICMLGFLGQVVTRNGIHFGGAIDKSGTTFDSVPNGWAAISGPDAIPEYGLWQIVFFIGFLEIGIMKDIPGTGNQFAGDFRNGASWDFGWDSFSEEEKISKRAIELNNGRAAQMGLLGLMVHEQLNNAGVVADLPIIGVLQ